MEDVTPESFALFVLIEPRIGKCNAPYSVL